MIVAQASRRGFTIVELLIVIVVIGILAAITIVAFNGVQNRARVAAVQADLTNSIKQLGIYKTATSLTSTYPAGIDCAASPAANTICLRPSNGTTYQYTYDAGENSFCLSAVNGTLAYHVSSSEGATASGVCSGHTSPTSPAAIAGVTSFIAGSTGGFANGTGASAQFNAPNDLALDSSGNIYVADLYNHRIRKITPAGVVTTFAGASSSGSADGTGTAASFYYPESVAVDASDNVYVADMYNNRIRKITPAGVVTTLAGSSSGYLDATGTSARFGNPRSLVVDASGNVFVVDTINNCIRKITPAGVVSTFAGSGASATTNGTGTAAAFKIPYGIGIDGDGNLYVAEYSGNVIRKITPAGVVTTLAGSGVAGYAEGTGSAAQFREPNDVAADSQGNVYVADLANHRIRKITPAGVVTTLAGSGVAGYSEGTGSAAQFSSPRGVTVSSDGTLYVADGNNSRIRKIQ